MQRQNWEFPYTADKLLAAAQAKVGFHTSRMDVWQKAREETEQKIKDSGITIDEGVDIGNQFAYSNSRAAGPQVRIDNQMVEHLNEAVAKVQEHRGKVREYGSWVQVLESQGQASFDLNQDDWLFFFGK